MARRKPHSGKTDSKFVSNKKSSTSEICLFPEEETLALQEWALRMHEREAIVLDTEATGGSFLDEVCDLGLVQAWDGKILFDSLLKPNVQMNHFAFQCHGITSEMLLGAPRLSDEDVHRKIFSLLDGAPVIAYNAAFDSRLLNQTFERYRLPMPSIEWHCLQRAYTRYTGRKRATKLSRACLEMEITPGNHRAVSDALAAARLLWRFTRRHRPSEVGIRLAGDGETQRGDR